MPIDTVMLENLGLTLKLIKSYFQTCSDASDAEKHETIGSMLGFARKCGRDSDIKALNAVLSEYAFSIAESVSREGLTEKAAKNIIELMNESNANGLSPELRELQDIVYPYYKGDAEAEADEKTAREAYSLINFQ